MARLGKTKGWHKLSFLKSLHARLLRFETKRFYVRLRRKVIYWSGYVKNKRNRTTLATLLFLSVLFIPFNASVNLVGAMGYANKKLPIILADGGYLRHFSVIDGQHVTKGELLATLDEPKLQADLDGLMNRAGFLACKAERLRSLSMMDEFVFPEQYALIPQGMIKGYCDEEIIIRRSAYEVYEKRIQVLESQEAAYSNDLKNLGDALGLQKSKLQIQKDMVAKYKALYKDGYVAQAQYLEQQSRLYSLGQELVDSELRLTDRLARKLEIEKQLQELRSSIAEQFRAEYVSTHAEMESMYAQLKAMYESHSRLAVYAPASGFVHNTVKLRPGVYVGPREVIMEIVPDTDRLVAVAQFKPSDHALIRVNQDVLVRLQTHNQSFAPEFHGKVLMVSPDLKSIQPNSPPLFEIFVEFDCDERCIKQHNLAIGVPVDVYVLGEKRSLFSYLVNSMIKSSNNALSEPN